MVNLWLWSFSSAMRCSLHLGGVSRRLAASRLSARPVHARLVPPSRRAHLHVQAIASTTEELLTVADAPSSTSMQQQAAASTNGGATYGVTTPAVSSSSTDSSFRHLPRNSAPETTYTVDNVAAVDVTHFTIHPSVPYWSNVETRFGSFYNKAEPNAEQLPEQFEDIPGSVAQLLGSALSSGDAESAAYWAYHLSRTTFFLGAAATGAVAHHLAFQAQGLLQSMGFTLWGASSSSSSTMTTSSSSSSAKKSTPWENLSANARGEVLNRVQESLAVYRRDLQYIREGRYKMPWDMTDFPAHRQYNPLYVARKAAQFCGEAVSTLNRRLAQGPADNWFVSNMYPSYYADNTFHYQTDGWLSSRSAEVYEFSTEALFFGRQDAMQRTTLLPLADFIRGCGADPSALRVAEVGCGTGRFHTFIKDNLPTLQTIACDLSPFYLQQARDNVVYWKSQRYSSLDLGGADGTGVQYMQAPMESLALPDGSLDAVVCVYCFHEMPEEAREAAAAEWYRVLKPGGLVVLTDSVQLGDRPAWDRTLGMFGNMNEPHYRNYIACDLGSLFEAAGFRCGTKYLCSATKTLSFTKPQQQQQQQQ